MDANKQKMALAAAQANELHAAHEGMACVGEDASGRVLVKCSCGVEMAVSIDATKVEAPAEAPSQPARRRSARDEGGE